MPNFLKLSFSVLFYFTGQLPSHVFLEVWEALGEMKLAPNKSDWNPQCGVFCCVLPIVKAHSGFPDILPVLNSRCITHTLFYLDI